MIRADKAMWGEGRGARQEESDRGGKTSSKSGFNYPDSVVIEKRERKQRVAEKSNKTPSALVSLRPSKTTTTYRSLTWFKYENEYKECG